MEIIERSGEDGAPGQAVFDLAICSCYVDPGEQLMGSVVAEGSLYCLDGADRMSPVFRRYWRGSSGRLESEILGTVVYARDSGEILIDLGYVDQQNTGPGENRGRHSSGTGTQCDPAKPARQRC